MDKRTMVKFNKCCDIISKYVDANYSLVEISDILKLSIACIVRLNNRELISSTMMTRVIKADEREGYKFDDKKYPNYAFKKTYFAFDVNISKELEKYFKAYNIPKSGEKYLMNKFLFEGFLKRKERWEKCIKEDDKKNRRKVKYGES